MQTNEKFRLRMALWCLALLLATFTGCTKETIETDLELNTHEQPGLFRKQIELHDGQNSVTLLVSAENQEVLNAFEASISMKAVAKLPIVSSETTSRLKAGDSYSEENAVHISVVETRLTSGLETFELLMDEDKLTGKTSLYGVYSGGPYYFYSWEAPHYFKVTPRNGKCVSAWLYQAGSNWAFVSWAGGSGGNYLCTNWWAASSSVTTLDYRLKAQGANFSVTWY